MDVRSPLKLAFREMQRCSQLREKSANSTGMNPFLLKTVYVSVCKKYPGTSTAMSQKIPVSSYVGL